MKNLIIVFMFLCIFALSGCKDDEVIELYSSKNLSGDTIDISPQTIHENVEADKEDESENIDKTAGNEETSRPFVVYVCGEVNKPGVYNLSDGSRIIDAITLAGGYAYNASENYLNLAETVTDGQMIYVPSKEEAEEGTVMAGSGVNLQAAGSNTSTGSSLSSGSSLVNLNKASKEELMQLPGIGEAKAEKIIEFRNENGGFTSIEDIMLISGIKEGLFNKVKDKICVK